MVNRVQPIAPFSETRCTLCVVRCTLFCCPLHPFYGCNACTLCARRKGCNFCTVYPVRIDAVLAGSPATAASVRNLDEPPALHHALNLILDRARRTTNLFRHRLDAREDVLAVVVTEVSQLESEQQFMVLAGIAIPHHGLDLDAHAAAPSLTR